MRGVDIDLFSVCGPKMTCFKYRDRLTWFCVGGRKWIGFRLRSVVVGGHPGYIPGFPMGIWILEYNGCCSLLLETSPTVVLLLGGSSRE